MPEFGARVTLTTTFDVEVWGEAETEEDFINAIHDGEYESDINYGAASAAWDDYNYDDIYITYSEVEDSEDEDEENEDE